MVIIIILSLFFLYIGLKLLLGENNIVVRIEYDYYIHILFLNLNKVISEVKLCQTKLILLIL
jgi:hypothetical protein